MTSQGTQRTDTPGRLLRRRTSDRVIGGVAGGLADYFNVDPLLIRIGFVGLIIFGGAGLALYLVAWLLMPAEGQDLSPVEALIRRVGLSPGRILTLAVVAVVLLLLMNSWNTALNLSGRDGVLWALAVIVVGFLLIRRREPASAAFAVASAPAVIAPSRAPAVRRPPSPLAWYVYAAVLIGVGALALFSQVAGVAVGPGQFFGAALAVMGVGLVIGAWWGRARILILMALLLMPVAIAASFVTAPLEGGVGTPRFVPANAAEMRDEYRLLGGHLTLDLSKLSVGNQPIHIVASVAVGKLTVILPLDASVELRTRAGAGAVTLFQEYNVGTSLDDHYVRRHQYGATYVLDLQVGIGEVLVINDIGGAN